ncbi:hypothetical protein PHLGIDRAFT_71740 [Phlebiopsis gigantea 11061_1 CR5-6]|uniref:Thioredoxin-like fold domain-containing protein n=1 Tax=Phlebiopsis gigantea (strain 11061_1 CR5-6) TaxID=745531 RepID=A0A0C3NPI3_PHLG1|nr:hypothetical protein PHLGIDRAFT_71740 [Phlebiopsis gigantea 11061_1 CR5-6]
MRGKFDDDIKVPVVLGVMSACPDALLCESVFDRVLKRVGSKVDLSLTYIGQLNATEPDFGVNCKHGAVECAGNVQQLCAIKYLQTPAWWRFIQCQNFEGRYKVGLPETALKCAHAASLDWENSDVGQCAGADASGKGEEGIALLKESVQNTTKIGVEKSCTILISGRPVCIRDETWKQCDGGHAPEDFIRQINEEYARLNN